jgi:hypothetical protein
MKLLDAVTSPTPLGTPAGVAEHAGVNVMADAGRRSAVIHISIARPARAAFRDARNGDPFTLSLHVGRLESGYELG